MGAAACPLLVNGQSSNAEARRPEVVKPDHHDVSPPLRDLNFFGKAKTRSDFEPKRTEALGNSNSKTTDPLAATSFTTTAASVSPIFSFEGVPVDSARRVAPPDTVGAVGLTQYVQWVNLRFAVFDKATGAMAANFPKQGNAIWAGFADFYKRARDAAEIAYQASRAETEQVFKEQVAQLRVACDSCHGVYMKKD